MPYENTNLVSAIGCPVNDELDGATKYAPLGAAVWTGSGKLANQGITAIVQAASGAMRSGPGYDPTVESFKLTIQNSFALAASHGRSRLAVPFIGGGIFFHRIVPSITRQCLAQTITEACLAHHGQMEAVIVAYPHDVYALFAEELRAANDPQVSLLEGSITDFALHQCDVIINAANMEVVFGGGLSGRIADAANGSWTSGDGETSPADEIDQEAQVALAEFWKVNRTAIRDA